MRDPYFTVKNLSLSLPRGKEGNFSVLHNINLTVHRGEFMVLLGPSGCGKSTFLRVIADLEKHHHAGHITWHEGYNPTRTSFVFQNFGLMPWLTVYENVLLPLIGRGNPKNLSTEKLTEARRDKVMDVLAQLGLAAFANYHPRELSGGMKQRVGLARALVTDPHMILLDEPFSELDFFTAARLRNDLINLWQEHKMTIVMVSHYIEEAVSLADTIAVFSDRPGTIRTIHKNHLPRPRDTRDKAFYAVEDDILAHFDASEMHIPPAGQVKG